MPLSRPSPDFFCSRMQVWWAGELIWTTFQLPAYGCSLEGTSQQCSRTPSRLASSEILSSDNFRQSCVAVNRQHDSGYLPEQRGAGGGWEGDWGGAVTNSIFHVTFVCKLHVSLTATFVPGKLKVLADSLSRKGQIIHSERTFHKGTLSQISLFWEFPHIDLFSTGLNNRLPIFISPFKDPLAWVVDAMSLSWERMIAYAFPPIPLLMKVLLKM